MKKTRRFSEPPCPQIRMATRARRCAPFLLALLFGCGKPPLRFPLERTPSQPRARQISGECSGDLFPLPFRARLGKFARRSAGGRPVRRRQGTPSWVSPHLSQHHSGSRNGRRDVVRRGLLPRSDAGHRTRRPHSVHRDALSSILAAFRRGPGIHHRLRALASAAAQRLAQIRNSESGAGADEAIAAAAAQFFPDLSTPQKRGAYLAAAAACTYCHTARQNEEDLPGMSFAGGMPFQGAWGNVASANLTPDPSGIPYYDEHMFLEVMRTGRNDSRKINPVMPWPYFREMAEAICARFSPICGRSPP